MEIKNSIKGLLVYITRVVIVPIAYIRLKWAIRKADEAHRSDGNRYFVIPDSGGALIVISRKVFRDCKIKRLIPRDANINDIKRTSFYFTPTRGEEQILSEADMRAKRRMYMHWVMRRL